MPMLRVLIYALGILHLGPGLAFAILAFGCGGITPLLGAMCGRQQLQTFALLTLAGWLLMTLALWTHLRLKRARKRSA